MKDKINCIPYIVTFYGTVYTDKNTLTSMQEQLQNTDIRSLVDKADSKFIEVNEAEFYNMEAKHD